MIITSKLAWYHLPKTAGTTTEKLFRASGIPLLWNDPQDSPVKHLPPYEHPRTLDLPLHECQHVVNFRRLPSWLLSNYHHKIKKMRLDIPFDPVAKGFFWRDRIGEWLPADWWLERFSVNENWSILRVEHIKQDFLDCLTLNQPINCFSSLRVHFVPSMNQNSYKKNLSEWFSLSDLNQLYETNPRWATLEKHVYGRLLSDSDFT